MARVDSVSARWILDSRGLPTLKVQITLEQSGQKFSAEASVPSGASTGSFEALEMRDGDKSFYGKGVLKAVKNVNSTILAGIRNKEVKSAQEIDQLLLNLDGTANKSNLGANAILGVSMASYRAFSKIYNLDLWQYLRRIFFANLPVTQSFPRLMCNIINGGKHADNDLDIQEFMIVPNTGFLEKDVQVSSEIYHTLKKELHQKGLSTSLGDEGGFAPNLANNEQALELLQLAIEKAGQSSKTCDLALDCAANEFFLADQNKYQIDGQALDKVELTKYYQNLKNNYNIISIEDAFCEDDVEGWMQITKTFRQESGLPYLIGDDLFVTNPERFRVVGLKNQIASGVLIKLNQIGTVLETAEMINLAKMNNYVTAVSHRSGETMDTFISDLAFASQSEFIKLGAPARGERVAKYNRLLEILDDLE